MAQRMEQKLIDEAIEYVKELFCKNSDGHGFDHTMRVYRNAMAIAETENSCDTEIVALAALLHDADDHKLFNSENNENARSFLKQHEVDESRIGFICEIVNEVSFSKNRDRHPLTIEGMIVQDADRLDALGAVGIARTFAYGGKQGRSLDDSIQHFHDKLLLLKDLMNTETGKHLAENRHDFLDKFLDQYYSETGEKI